MQLGNQPNIHACGMLYTENKELNRKLTCLKKKYMELMVECEQYKTQKQEAELLRDKVTTRCTYVQTEYMKPTTCAPMPRKPPVKESPLLDAAEDNKLIAMQNQLMKRYERELKKNLESVELVTKLQLRIAEQDKRLHVISSEQESMQRELNSVRSQLAASKAANHKQKVSTQQLGRTQKEVQTLRAQNERMKQELRGLDPTFFEEVEDLKFALQESTRLNEEYEKSLCKLCKRYGLPYPYKRAS